jgi:hypothetical protein
MSHSIKMPTIRRLCRFIGLTIIMVLQGCSTNPKSVDALSGANAEVRVQVCLPAKRIYFNDLVLERLENHPLFTKYSQQQLELAPKVIRRVADSSDSRAIHAYGISFGEVLIRDGQFSDGVGFVPIQDSTVANQPVYERGYGYPASNYVAIHVRLPQTEMGAKGRVTYWFVLPKNIPNNGFTPWFKAISMEPEGQRPPLWWKLTHGGDLAIYPVSADSPMMRVSLMQRHTKHDDPTIDTLPALTTARLKYKTATSDQQFVYEFVPKATEAIPVCE